MRELGRGWVIFSERRNHRETDLQNSSPQSINRP